MRSKMLPFLALWCLVPVLAAGEGDSAKTYTFRVTAAEKGDEVSFCGSYALPGSKDNLVKILEGRTPYEFSACTAQANLMLGAIDGKQAIRVEMTCREDEKEKTVLSGTGKTVFLVFNVGLREKRSFAFSYGD